MTLYFSRPLSSFELSHNTEVPRTMALAAAGPAVRSDVPDNIGILTAEGIRHVEMRLREFPLKCIRSPGSKAVPVFSHFDDDPNRLP